MGEKTLPSILWKDLIVRNLLIVCLLTGLANASCIRKPRSDSDLCHSEVYCTGPLLKTVQLARIYNDSKTFVDLYQLNDPNITIAHFDELMANTSGEPTKEQIRQFVDENFAKQNELVSWVPPDWQENPEFLKRVDDSNFRNWVKQLNDIWKILAKKISPNVTLHPDRHSLINVDNGFIVPGGRFQEFYYWDSYWVIKGLLLTGMKDTTKGILENFLSMVSRYGFIPNGGRVYYLMRSQPPLLIPMVKLYLEYTNDTKFLADNLLTMEKEFAYFQRFKRVTVVKNGTRYTMARYVVNSDGPRPESYWEDWDLAENLTRGENKKTFYEDMKAGAESGWDFSSRWFIAPDGGVGNRSQISTRHIIPVDLNAFLQRNARLLAEFNNLFGNTVKVKYFKDIAAEYQRGIDNVLWNEAEGVWLDYDTKNSRPRNNFYPSNIAPLYTGSFDVAKSQFYADKVVVYLKRTGIGNFMGGTPASMLRTREQWDMPNAWPPLQSMIVYGLRNTGKASAMTLAEELAIRWLRANYRGFSESGSMFEKYDAEFPGTFGGGGEYVVQAGFGWTNGVVLEFLNTYPNANSTDNSYANGNNVQK